jgi:putative transposase
VSVWNWIQRFASYQIYQRKKKRATAYISDETVIEIAKKHFWLWICIEPIHNSVLRIHISNERNMLVVNILSDFWSKSIESIP